MLTPNSLIPGDTIAILSPASAIDPELIAGAKRALESAGYRVRVMPHACGRSGSYAATAAERLDDLRAALADPEVKAILCGRGGYGTVHLLGHVEPRPVWLIGFSDISALHALWHSAGITSVHGSMAKHLAQFPIDDEPNSALLKMFATGRQPHYQWPAHPLNRPGTATGVLRGGNLAVLAGLIGTPYDELLPGSILMIEDIAEPIYKVERILHQLRLRGVLGSLSGLIVGQFTEYRSSADWPDMERMIAAITAPYAYPVAFGAPFGHIDANLPLLLGSEVTLTVGSECVIAHS